MWNTLKTTILLASLTALLMVIGRAFGGNSGMLIAFGIAVVMNLGSWWFSDTIVLRMYRAQEVSASTAPQLYRMVQELAAKAEMPMPKVYIVPEAMPNAFATGRSPNKAAVAVTEGLLRLVSPEELRGVLAHELAHVANRDTFISAVSAVIAGAIGMIANMAQWALIFGGGRRDEEEGSGGGIGGLVAILLAPLLATVIQLAISRSREYAADEWAARLIGDGRPLASALRRLESGVAAVPHETNTATAHMFIMSPLGGGGGLFSLFRTHPATDDRVARLIAVTEDLGRRGTRAPG